MIEFFLSLSGAPLKPIGGNVKLLNSNIGTSLSGSMCAVLGNYFYMAGGRDTNGAVNTFRRFNLISREWESLAVLPTVRAAGQLLASGANLYLFGGYSTTSSTYPSTIHRYDPANNIWTTLGSSPNNGRSWLSGAAIGDNLYFFGGWIGSQLRNAERYNVTSNTWVGLQPLPESRHGHSCVAVGGQIYIFGGLTTGGTTVNNDTIQFAPSSQYYTNMGLGGRPTRRCYTSLVAGFGRLYVFGGYTDGNGTDSLADVWSCSTSNFNWSQMTLSGDPLTKRAVNGYALWKNEFHIVFGQAAASGSNIYRTDHLMIT